MNIANKTVLITGANRSIGRALVSEALSGARRISSPIRCRSPLRKVGGQAPRRRWSVSSRPSWHRALWRPDGMHAQF